MKDKDFNTDIRDKFRDFEIPVDQNALWDAISNDIPRKEEKRRPLFLWLSGSTALLALLFGIYFFNSDSTSTQSAKELTNSIPTQKLSELPSHKNDQELITSSQVVEDYDMRTESRESNELNSLNNSSDLPTSSTKMAMSENTGVSTSTSSDSEISTTKTLPSKINEPQTSNKSTTVESINKGLNNSRNYPNNITNDRTSPTKLIKSSELNENGAKETTLLTEKRIDQINQISTLNTQPLTYDQTIKPISILTPKPSKFLIHLETSYGVARRSIRAQDTEVEQYAQLLKTKEKVLRSAGVTLGIAYRLNRNWVIKTGIDYQQIASRLLHQESTISTSTVTDSTIRILNDGATELISEEYIVTRTQSTSYKRFTKHNLLSIPLILEYNLTPSSRWSTCITGGLLFNIKQTTNGTLLNPDGSLSRFSNSEAENPYSNNLNLGYQLGSTIYYSLTDRLEVGLSGQFRNNGNLFQDQTNLISNYQNINAAISVRVGL